MTDIGMNATPEEIERVVKLAEVVAADYDRGIGGRHTPCEHELAHALLTTAAQLAEARAELMRYMNVEENGQAVIENGALVIRVSLESLPAVVEGAWAAYGMPLRLKITDADAFAKELVGELNAEQEDGTTSIHRMFDKAIWAAFENGAEGVEEHEEQDGMIELRLFRRRFQSEAQLQYRFIQPTVNASGALCPGDWSEWKEVPTVDEGKEDAA